MQDRWIDFYLGNNFDHRGRTIEQLWSFSDRSLEAVHDYIQWLVPLRSPSPYNPEAPLLNDTSAAFARSSPEMRRRLLTSLQRMLHFYGLGLEPAADGSLVVVLDGERIDERMEVWISDGNHNYLRITRMLACLSEVGLAAEARSFLGVLEELYAVEDDLPRENRIGPRTLGFWRAACGVPGEDAG
jgi:hypothetical protein